MTDKYTLTSSDYAGNEQSHWEARIRENDRYSSVGINSLPNSINRYRKETLFDVIDTAVADQEIDFSETSVLDAGCGTGIYSDYYTSRGADVSGVDISPAAIETIQKEGIPGEYYQSGLSDLPFSDGEFDLTHVFSVLYHIVNDDEWAQSLEELDRVTAPGGQLMMRIEWCNEEVRKGDHVKHRPKEQYLDLLTGELSYTLEGVYSFADVVPFQRFFIAADRIFPSTVSAWVSGAIDWLGLLKENKGQRVVVFRKTE